MNKTFLFSACLFCLFLLITSCPIIITPIVEKIDINGICYYEDFTDLNPNGSIRKGELCSNVTINGINYIGNISFYNNGNVQEGQLSHLQTIDGVSVSGNICYYEDGKIRGSALDGEHLIHGFYHNGQIDFYNNASVKEEKLSRGQVIEGIFYGQETYIVYYPDGSFSNSGLANSFYCR